MFNLDKSILDWLRQFNRHQAFDEGSLQEMELHVRDHFEDLINEGHDPEEAFRIAIKSFGDISPLAEEELSTQKRARSRAMVIYGNLLKNYLKTNLRSMGRNPLSSFINLTGLSAAIGICVFTYAFAQWTLRTDQFHEHKEEVFLATFFSGREGSIQQNGRSPRPLGEMLKKDFPEISEVCRVQRGHAVVKYDDKVFHERIYFVDPTYLEFFTFPLKSGAINSLEDVNSIILSEKTASRYFGEDDPIGRSLLLKFGEDQSKTFRVSGVARKFPPSISFNFQFLINYKNLSVAHPDRNEADWGSFVDATYVRIEDPRSIERIQQNMDKYRVLQNRSGKDWQIESFAFEPLATLAQRSSDIRNTINISLEEGTLAIVFLAFVGVFMLLLACFNYINIAIVSATRRLKEIGIRKTIGASKKGIIFQFLYENLVATSFALVLGLILGTYLFIPWFESLFYFTMGFTLFDSYLWVYLVLVLLFTGVVSGLYPAFYISKFPLTGILKGSVKFGRRNGLTRVILGFQLILSCLFITCAIMFTQNASYLSSRSWGYNEDGSIYAEVSDPSSFRLLHSSMEQETGVISISGSKHHLGKSSHSTIIKRADQEFEADQLEVDASYFETMGIELLSGRSFHMQNRSDQKSVVVNEYFAKTILEENELNASFKIDSNQYTVIGVVKDFHTYNFEHAIAPTFFTVSDPEDFRFLSIKVRDGEQQETYQALQDKWAELFPETPFMGGYQEDVWGMYFVEIGIHGKVWRAIASIAIILASLGLYGLVSLNVAGRTREFSIRKTLGANLKNIGMTISRDYSWLFIISLGIAAPASFFLLNFLLDFIYVYHMPLSLLPVGVAVSILLFILIAVIVIQMSRIGTTNPVKGLNDNQ